MASSQSETIEQILGGRETTVDPTEPIHSEPRTVTKRGSEHESLYANITDRASDLIDVEAGDDIIVHSYHGFLLIEPADDGDHSEC